MFTNAKRILRAGFVGFWRNGFISISSILVLIIALFTIGSVIFVGAVLRTSLAQLQSKADINIYFTTTADPEDIVAIQKRLEQLPEVASVAYISREKALEEFKNKPGRTQGDLDALDILGDNPFGARLNIFAKNPSQYETISNFFKGNSALSKEGQKIVNDNDYERNHLAIEKLTTILDTSNKVGLGVAALLVALAIIITFNTIRIAIYASRDEIAVMKLVGATNHFTRGPFVVSGVMYGAIAGVVTLLIFIPITYSLGTITESFLSSINLAEYYRTNFLQIAAILLGSGIVIGAISSYLAVRRYLRA